MFKCYLLRTVEVALNPVPPSCTPIRALLRKRLFNSHSSLPRFKFPMLRTIPQGLSHGCRVGEEGRRYLHSHCPRYVLTHPFPMGISLALGP